MRRAVLAIFLCAAPMLAASAPAWAASMSERVALHEVLRQQAGASSGQRPLPPLSGSPRAFAASPGGSLARRDEPARVLVGVSAHEQLAAVADEVARLGGTVERLEGVGVVAAHVPSAADLMAALRDDPRVAYVERDARLRVSADEFDVLDPNTGLKYTWAYEEVHAGEALAAVGGGSRREVAVVDTGLDLNHPEFAGRIGRRFDTATGGADVTDSVGHGTFVTGLINAIDGNAIGGKGVAGNTRVLPVRASRDCSDGSRGCFAVSDLIRGIAFAIRNRADVINLSLSGQGFSQSQARALEAAFFADVLPVGVTGNNALAGNPLEFPGAVLGGFRGGRGIGLSVGASDPDGRAGAFSNHNDFISLVAPGASNRGCQFGVFSTLPANTDTEWDMPSGCPSQVFNSNGRYAYGEGTSFAAPVASGIAALAWQAEPRLASEQVGDVLVRSAHQEGGGGWNQFTGAGVVDGAAAVIAARAYDVIAPKPRARARRAGNSVRVRVSRSRDRSEPGRKAAGRVRYSLLVSRDGGRNYGFSVRPRSRPFSKAIALRGSRANVFVATICDGNGNCAVKRLGRFRRR